MEMELSFLLGALLLLLPLLVTKWYIMCTNRRKLPPGPTKLPFLGNLHQLIDWKSSELLPHRTLAKLASKHGPLMHMKLGERSAIIVSSPQMVREVMRKHDLNFSNRPVLLIGKEIFYDHADMGFRNYGDFWIQMRKICMQELLSHKNIQSFYPKMFNEISNLVSSIKADSGSPINLTETLSLYTNWVICNASVGRACKNQGSLVDIMRTVAGSAGVFDLADLFPSVKIIHFFSELKYKLRKMHGEVDILLEEIINEHDFQSGSTNGDPTEEDIVDVLLRLQKSQDFPIPITRDNIKALIIDLFSGGSTTSASTMEWIFSELMRNPKIMKKAQDEVREVFKGKENRINQSDIQKLKYLKMVVKETLRFHPLAPLLAPRESREECEINGYVIPKGTMALVNFWAISRDPNYWQNPETFDPERFNESHLDFTGAHSEFTPFGSGRRICPGQSFAMATVELCLALLLYHFDWKLPNGMKPNELDMAEKFGNTLERKNNLYLIPLPYVHA